MYVPYEYFGRKNGVSLYIHKIKPPSKPTMFDLNLLYNIRHGTSAYTNPPTTTYSSFFSSFTALEEPFFCFIDPGGVLSPNRVRVHTPAIPTAPIV